MALLCTSETGPEMLFDRSQLLRGSALGTMQHLGTETMVLDEDNNLRTGYRMARYGRFALLEKPTDDTSPQCIDCYLVEVQEFVTPPDSNGQGVKFKLDPARALFLHDPQEWFATVGRTLLRCRIGRVSFPVSRDARKVRGGCPAPPHEIPARGSNASPDPN